MRPAPIRLVQCLAPLIATLLTSPLVAAEFNMNVTATGIRPGRHVAGPMLAPDAIANRVVLLEFWGLNCPPCIRSMPMLEELHTTLGPHGLVVIGAHAQGGSAAIPGAIKGQIRSLAQGIGKACPGSSLADKAAAIAAELAPTATTP